MVFQHHHRPQPGQHLHRPVAPLSLPSTPPLSLCARVLAHHESALTPFLSSTRHASGGQYTHHALWGGTTMSRPYLTALRPSGTQQPRTHQQAHTRARTRKQASKPGQRGGRSHTAPPPQASAPTPRNANTKRRTRPARKHQTQPPTEQTRPQQACSSTTRANTKSAHTVTCGRSQV